MKTEFYTDEEDWYNDKPYECPHCGSFDVERTLYCEGMTHKVKFECGDCNELDYVE